MKTRLAFHGIMVLALGLILYLTGEAGLGRWAPVLEVGLYILGMLFILPYLTGDPANFPDRGRLSAALERLRDTPGHDTGRAELIALTLSLFEQLFKTRVYFLDAQKNPRLFQTAGPPGTETSLMARPLGAAAWRYQAFARGLPDEGFWLPPRRSRQTRSFYRPRGIRGDYFLPLNMRNETAGVICLRRGRNFSRRQRTLLRETAEAVALLLRTADLRERVGDNQEELRRREKHLTRMEGMTRSLLNHITREIARPIDDIENNAQRLSSSPGDTGHSTIRIQKLHLLAHQVSALLEDSLLLVELESGTYRLDVAEHNVREILREALLEARMKLPDSRIQIEIDFPDDVVARVDRYLLGSALYRLFRTIRLIPRRGVLHVARDGEDLRLTAHLDLPDEGGPGRLTHLNQLYPYLQTFTKTMNKSVRLMGSRLEFPGGLDRILSIRFPSPLGPGEDEEDGEAEAENQ